MDSLRKYWKLFPNLKEKLFSVMRENYDQLNVPKDEVRSTIYADEEFCAYAERVDEAFEAWRVQVDDDLRDIDEFVEPKELIAELSKLLITQFEQIELIDPYDVYEVLLSYWNETMADDVYVVAANGYEEARETENIMGVYTSGKKKGQEKVIGWEGVLIPKTLVEKQFFSAERRKIDEAQQVAGETQSRLDELTEEQTGEDGVLFDCLNDKDAVDAKQVTAKQKELKKSAPKSEECKLLAEYAHLAKSVKDQSKAIKELNAELDDKVNAKYTELSEDEIKGLLVNRKWYYTIFAGIKSLYDTTSHNMASRIVALAERYEDTLPQLEQDVETYEAKVKAHLERMGFVW